MYLYREQIQWENHVQQALATIYEDEEMYWQQRFSETWLLQKDNNIVFFNGIARKKIIFFLK
jgi:hypothetical protein